MNIKFEVKMTKKAMFDFMLYTSYTSLSGIVGVIFGGVHWCWESDNACLEATVQLQRSFCLPQFF